MSILPGLFCVDNKSYQHLQGVMLVNLNKIAQDQKLTHSEYRLMGILIGYWSKKHQKAYPSLRMIAKTSRMSNSTVIKAINNLKTLQLIVVTKDGRAGRNNYHINIEKFLNQESNKTGTHKVIKIDTSCSSTKHKKNKTDIDKPKEKNENDFNNFSSKQIIEQLREWKVMYPEKIVANYPENLIVNTINTTLNSAANNPGAYFRTILSKEPAIKSSNHCNSALDTILKAKYIEHKPSQKVFKIKPDQGNHLLFRYLKEQNSLMMIDTGFIDSIENFMPINEEVYKSRNKIVYIKPSKDEIIKQLEKTGNQNQIEQLKNIWKLN